MKSRLCAVRRAAIKLLYDIVARIEFKPTAVVSLYRHVLTEKGYGSATLQAKSWYGTSAVTCKYLAKRN